MSSSTLATLVTTSIASAWDYILATFTPLFLYGVGFAVLAGVAYFIWRRLHPIR